MALLEIPDDFGQGGANIGDGEIRLIDILKNHAEEIAELEVGSVDSTARAAAAAAQSTADGAVTVNTTQTTNITTAQTTANNAASAAATAQSTADGAVTVNTTQNGRLDALEAASSSPVLLSEALLGRFRSLSPSENSGLHFEEFAWAGGLPQMGWDNFSSPIATNKDEGTALKASPDAAFAVAALDTGFVNMRSKKWAFVGRFRSAGSFGIDPDEFRAIRMTGSDIDHAVAAGMFVENSTAFFSFTLRNTAHVFATSTIAFDGNYHVFEVWHDVDAGKVFGSIDGETPVVVSSVTTDIPDEFCGLAVGNFKGALATSFFDSIGIAFER